jgi:AraC-like DNA-binding protein
MTETPESFADRPEVGAPSVADRGAAYHGDLLSGLLRSVRLRGEEIFCCAPVAAFAISFDHAGGMIHILNEGKFEVQLDGQRQTRRYEQGDVILLPAGAAHVVRNGRRVPRRALVESDVRDEIVRHGTGTRWLSGTFSFDDSRGGRLLHALPPVVDLRGARDQSLGWLDVSTQMLMQEKIFPSEGSSEMISRILDLLFINVLRAWAVRPDATAGWLTGAMDSVIGDAMTAIHANPGHPWTVKRLADKCNLSRSAFSERFVRTVGQPPAAYIAQVRLEKAADLLQYTTDAVGAIARDVGYDSEAAFSRAFSKRHGIPPARWRRQPAQREADSSPPGVK